MSMIQISNLTFAYEGGYDNIFENLSLQIDTSWKLGLVGRNGRGKTTLLKLLMGQYSYQGQILADTQFDYFPFTIEDPRQSALEAALGVCPDCPDWILLREFSKLKIEEETYRRPYITLSLGERTKILLAALFAKENRFLLIDEPTNHLDQPARRLVGDYLAGKQGFILVSHDRAFLDRCTDHILSINPSELQIQKGNFSSWQENKRRQDQFELSQSEKLKKEIGRLSSAARQASQWAGRVEREKYGSQTSGTRPERGNHGHKSAKMMKRAKALETRRLDALREKEELLKNLEHTEDLRIRPLPFSGRRLAELKEVSIQYGNLTACKGVSFAIEPGDRIVLQGKNGSGKSSVLKLLLGEALSFSGQLTKDSRLNISYVSQDTTRLKGSLTEYAAARGLEESYLKAMLRKMGFSRSQLEKDCSDFSGGQKKKVLIAGSLCEAAHLYLWDEPLNDIDLFTRIQIEELLLAGKPTLVFVEHDAIFASKIATKAVNL